MGCEEVRENLGAYILGGLEPEEVADVRRHLETCAACRSELRELEAVKHALDATPRPAEPPPRLEGEILSRVRAEVPPPERREHRRGKVGRIGLFAVSLTVLAALALFAVLWIQRETQAPVATVKLRPAGAYASGLRSNGYWGVAEFYSRGSGNELMELKLNNLRTPGLAGPYKAWVFSGDKRLNAGTFRANSSGKTEVWLTVPSVSRVRRTVLITRGAAGSRYATGGEVVLRGEGR